jgi:ATP-dependent Clp protease ATP-binding subunit ClpA
MFERFNGRARRAMGLAQEAARTHNSDYIGTEHLLLGLMGAGDGVARRALDPLGIDLGVVAQRLMQRASQQAEAGSGADRGPVEEIAGQAELEPAVYLPFTQRAKEALQLAIREAGVLSLGDVGTEHILLGLIRVRDGMAAQALVKLGIDLNQVRQQVNQQLLGAAVARIDSLDRRLAAIELWVGMPVDLRGTDQEIAQVRFEKEDAIIRREFEVADELRDKEKQLLAARAAYDEEWTQPAAGRLSLAGELRRVNAELERLQTILHARGIEPSDDDPA